MHLLKFQLISEHSQSEKKYKELIVGYENSIGTISKQNKDYECEITILGQQFQKEKGLLLKKQAELEKNLQSCQSGYEEKFEIVNQENIEFRKTLRNQKKEIETLKKSNKTLEEQRIKFERLVYERDEALKQLTSFNDELISKLKKDPSNPDFKNTWYKKKRIESEFQKTLEKTPVQDKPRYLPLLPSPSSRRKSRSKSRSQSRSPFKKTPKTALTLEDLAEEDKQRLSESKYSSVGLNSSQEKRSKSQKSLLASQNKKKMEEDDPEFVRSDTKFIKLEDTYGSKQGLNFNSSQTFAVKTEEGYGTGGLVGLYQNRGMALVEIER